MPLNCAFVLLSATMSTTPKAQFIPDDPNTHEQIFNSVATTVFQKANEGIRLNKRSHCHQTSGEQYIVADLGITEPITGHLLSSDKKYQGSYQTYAVFTDNTGEPVPFSRWRENLFLFEMNRVPSYSFKPENTDGATGESVDEPAVVDVTFLSPGPGERQDSIGGLSQKEGGEWNGPAAVHRKQGWLTYETLVGATGRSVMLERQGGLSVITVFVVKPYITM